MVEVILTNEVIKLGDKGDIVRVRDGYARNYLYPQQLAIPASGANRRQIDDMRAAAVREAARVKGDAQKLAEALAGTVVNFTARAGEGDQLFGSITNRHIADELEKLGYTIDRHKILIDKPIRMLGEHEAAIHVHREINIPIKVIVVNEDGLLTTVKAAPAEEPVAAAKTSAPEDETESESASAEEPEVEDAAADDDED
jgi:large subunit ribosomal protein L9